MKFGSVCSGIEAATAAWHPLGWKAAWYSEIEPFPCAVLKRHYPETPNLGDINDICIDKDAKLIYSVPHGQEKNRTCGSCGHVSKWSICRGCGGFFWSDSSGNVGLAKAKRGPIPPKNKNRKRKSFTKDWEKIEQEGTSDRGESDQEGHNYKAERLRDVRQKLCSCQQAPADRGPSRRLQQAPGAKVALPRVPFLMAQKKSCHPPVADIRIDLLVGGFPCQDLSMAGKRKGLIDEKGETTRSGLFFRIMEIADAIGQRWTLLENVPGLLSSNKGQDFATVVGRMAGAGINIPDGGWENSGFFLGPKGLVEWRIMDAQYFGVPQRRRRVFIVRDSGDWSSRPPILLEPDGLRRNPAPRGKARQDVAGTIRAGSGGGCGLGPDEAAQGNLIAHSLRGEGFDASEDGTGRGTPIIIDRAAFNQGKGAQYEPTIEAGETMPSLVARGPHAIGLTRNDPGPHNDEIAPALRASEGSGNQSVVAFGSKDSGQDALEDISPTLRAGGHEDSHQNGGVPPAVCYDMRGNGDGDNAPTLTGHHAGAISDFSPVVFTQGNLARGEGPRPSDDVAPTFQSNAGDQHPCVFTQNSRSEVREMGDRTGAVTSEPGAQCQNYLKAGMTVRRLTPVECLRLQGFPDDYLEVYYANAVQAHAVQILHELWKTAHTFAREGWRSGIAASLLAPEILLSGVHVGWISWEMAYRCAAASRALSGAEPWPERFVLALRINAEHRPSPYRRESFEQCARELERPLSELSLERTQAETYLRGCGLWPTAQKEWPLRYALATNKTKRSGINPDGPRYKAIGNSMGVPVMRWIGERISTIEKIIQDGGYYDSPAL